MICGMQVCLCAKVAFCTHTQTYLLCAEKRSPRMKPHAWKKVVWEKVSERERDNIKYCDWDRDHVQHEIDWRLISFSQLNGMNKIYIKPGFILSFFSAQNVMLFSIEIYWHTNGDTEWIGYVRWCADAAPCMCGQRNENHVISSATFIHFNSMHIFFVQKCERVIHILMANSFWSVHNFNSKMHWYHKATIEFDRHWF